ncbi:MAG: class I SAM-dependent methyltransferase [Actinomycetota bacterium]
MGFSEHAEVNRDHWNAMAHEWVGMGERAWAGRATPSWGIWSVPETELLLLPDDLTGRRSIELGCGTGYVSAWLAHRGAEVVGIDVSEEQLATARRLAEEHGVALELIHGSAEEVPEPDASFDFAVSEYGAALWCDPEVWLPEAHRLLRSGGELVFLTNHPFVMVSSPLDGSLPVTERLERPYFGMGRFDWTDAVDDPGGIEFNRTIADWFRLLVDTGFDVLALHELRAPEGGTEVRFFATADWAQRWPSEIAWRVRKR